MKRVLLGFAVAATALSGACTNEIIVMGGSGGTGGDTTTTTSNTNTVTTTTPTTTNPPPSTSTTGPQTCFDLPGDECTNCLVNQNPAGYDAYVAAYIDNCLCANECQMVCTQECLDPFQGLSPPCEECIAEAGSTMSACVEGFYTQCQESSACIQFLDDLQYCF
jgi:hypothetical protein